MFSIDPDNAVNEITTPNFKKLNNDALDALETDLTLLDAYATMYAGDADITIGRFVTSWGESTFIPVGANGLTTNAIDLTKLQGPGAAIREALIPTEAISLSTMADGVGVEVYYQLNSQSENRNIPNFLIENNFSANDEDLNQGLKLVGDFLEKSILKPNNLNQPISRLQFLSSLK